jgi:hypothetical protein
VRGRDRGGDRDERLLGGEVCADLAEQDVDVLRLDGDDDDSGPGDGGRVVGGRLGTVTLVEFRIALVAAAGDDDLGWVARS